MTASAGGFTKANPPATTTSNSANAAALKATKGSPLILQASAAGPVRAASTPGPAAPPSASPTPPRPTAAPAPRSRAGPRPARPAAPGSTRPPSSSAASPACPPAAGAAPRTNKGVTTHSSCFRGRPGPRSVDARPSRAAVRFTHSSSPQGRPRPTLTCKASSCSAGCARFNSSSQFFGRFTGLSASGRGGSSSPRA
jgi:hypothetical protein